MADRTAPVTHSADERVTHAGLVLVAADTGRVLMLQRALDDDDDPAAGMWEFPGGGVENGETPEVAARREWAEEVGQPVPSRVRVVSHWASPDGVYRAHIAVLPTEETLNLSAKRTVSNPDDLTEQVAWWRPRDAAANPALRRECHDTPWQRIEAVTTAPAALDSKAHPAGGDGHTGGMLALVPDDPAALAVDGGDDPTELHLTLLFLGDDVTAWPPEQAQRLRELVTASAPGFEPVDARIIGHAVFNPDGGPDGDRDPATVYLVGDAPGLAPLRQWAQWALRSGPDYPDPPAQFDPFIAHTTAGYGLDPGALRYVGPVRFSALRLALGGEVLDVALGDESTAQGKSRELTFTPPRACGLSERKALTMSQVRVLAGRSGPAAAWARGIVASKGAHVDTETKGGPSASERDRARFAGQTVSKESRSFPIRNLADLRKAIKAFGRAKPADRTAVKRHIMARARELKAGQETMDQIKRLGQGEKSQPDEDVEYKVKSPDPRAARLRRYWAHGKGRAKWRPGSPGDFNRLRRQLIKYVKTPRILNGLTANIHKMATGKWPGRGRGHKSLVDWDAVEVKDEELEVTSESELFDGIEEWGGVFAEEDVSGFGDTGPDDGGDGDGDADDEGKDDADDIEHKSAQLDADRLETSRLALLGAQIFGDGEHKAARDDDDDDETEPGDEAGDTDGDESDGDEDDEEDWPDVVNRDVDYDMAADGTMHRRGAADDDEVDALFD